MSRKYEIPNDTPGVDISQVKAVIFDMDGVVTHTADIHAAAWKRMFDEYLQQQKKGKDRSYHPFDIDRDYRRYVDGKPRYDGVQSFLKSRKIALPYGNPNDSDDKVTICGLGNRKNRYFLEALKKQGVEPYRSTVDFIKKLKRYRVKTAVISSSRNCREVLKSAGVESLFDVKFDGVDMDRLQLKGKPDPAIFLQAINKLDVSPEQTAIVEDALAGVDAGRRGNFKLVIGINRDRRYKELQKHGADIVVDDLSRLSIEGSKQRTKSLPSALKESDGILHMFDTHMPVIFLDYDGTLTPIVEEPCDAALPEKTKQTLMELADLFTVAIISGRDLQDIRNMVDIDTIVYAGSHGFDIQGPGGSYRLEKGKKYLPALDRAEKELTKLLSNIQGARIERKRFSIAVHYRMANQQDIPAIEQDVDAVATQEKGLRKTQGKKIFELSPDIKWDKGKALQSLVKTLYSRRRDVLPIYIGDDVTDENAFRAIKSHGLPIVVGKAKRQTTASYQLKNPEEVRLFLEKLLQHGQKQFVVEAWTLKYDYFDPEQEKHREALCTLGNGYFATRGAAPESVADDTHYPGTYIAGCFNRLKSKVSGQTIENESMVNAPNWQALCFRPEDGHWFDMENVELLDFKQELDLRRGVLSRFIRYKDGQGRITRFNQRRFVSIDDPHIAALETTLVPENWAGTLEIRTALDGTVTNSGVERYRRLNNKHLSPFEQSQVDEETVYLKVETVQSAIRISEAARTRVFLNQKLRKIKRRLIDEPGYIAHECLVPLKKGDDVTIEKIVALFTSRDKAIAENGLAAREKVASAVSFDDLLARHVMSWDHLWRRCRMTLRDNVHTALVLHLHIFHVLQTVSVNTIDLDVGIPARGLHGEAYRGHILWDELFVFPFVNLRIPDLIRALLMYRYRRLPKARQNALAEGHEGALYPWQSGSDGREESQSIHLNPLSGCWIPDNSWRQRHINIAIAYNIWLYYQVTADNNFLSFHGGEMFLEIARFLANIASLNKSLDRYEIKKVMGPDEYHDAYPDSEEPGIDNNSYTNIMTAWVMCRSLELLDMIPDDRHAILCEKLSLGSEELERWDDISRKMRICFHGNNIISQFEGYERLKEFDWDGYRKRYGNIQRLDRILESEGDTTNRYKLSKQADVLMLFYLLSADELYRLFARLGYELDSEAIPRNVRYYMERTAHGSTLSRIVHSWVLARSQREQSWHLFKQALESDISDIQGGTTPEGIHLGAMAGTVDILQRCYTGIETRGETLWLNPFLPGELKELKFTIQYRGHVLDLSIGGKDVVVTARRSEAGPMKLGFRDRVVRLKQGQTKRFKI